MEIFEGEGKIIKIGGRLCDDFYRLRTIVLYLNSNVIPLYTELGFTSPEDTTGVINAIISDDALSLYDERINNLIKDGSLKLENFLPKSSFDVNKKKYDTKEKEEQHFKRCLRMQIIRTYKDTYKRYLEDYRPSKYVYNKNILDICRDSLFLLPSWLNIDVGKFIDLYSRYLEVDECEAKREQEKIASDINHFFNGVEITEKELKKYFVIRHGVVKINPGSVKSSDYARLGKRVFEDKRK